MTTCKYGYTAKIKKLSMKFLSENVKEIDFLQTCSHNICNFKVFTFYGVKACSVFYIKVYIRYLALLNKWNCCTPILYKYLST